MPGSITSTSRPPASGTSQGGATSKRSPTAIGRWWWRNTAIQSSSGRVAVVTRTFAAAGSISARLSSQPASALVRAPARSSGTCASTVRRSGEGEGRPASRTPVTSAVTPSSSRKLVIASTSRSAVSMRTMRHPRAGACTVRASVGVPSVSTAAAGDRRPGPRLGTSHGNGGDRPSRCEWDGPGEHAPRLPSGGRTRREDDRARCAALPGWVPRGDPRLDAGSHDERTGPGAAPDAGRDRRPRRRQLVRAGVRRYAGTDAGRGARGDPDPGQRRAEGLRGRRPRAPSARSRRSRGCPRAGRLLLVRSCEPVPSPGAVPRRRAGRPLGGPIGDAGAGRRDSRTRPIVARAQERNRTEGHRRGPRRGTLGARLDGEYAGGFRALDGCGRRRCVYRLPGAVLANLTTLIPRALLPNPGSHLDCARLFLE